MKSYLCVYNYAQKIISLEDISYTCKKLFKLRLIMKIVNLFNEKFILFALINIVIFYSPLENLSEHFLFKARIFVEQIFDGILGILECFIPKYEEDKKDENKII